MGELTGMAANSRVRKLDADCLILRAALTNIVTITAPEDDWDELSMEMLDIAKAALEAAPKRPWIQDQPIGDSAAMKQELRPIEAELLAVLKNALLELDKFWPGLENPTAQKWWLESKTRKRIVDVIARAEGN